MSDTSTAHIALQNDLEIMYGQTELLSNQIPVI